jgi:hypothetical protein
MPTPTQTKKDEPESKSKSTDGQSTDAQGNVLRPGTIVPAVQSQELADKGIYQPVDQATNGPQAGIGDGSDPKDKETHEDHRKNLTKLPPVPSERSGAASQAK